MFFDVPTLVVQLETATSSLHKLAFMYRIAAFLPYDVVSQARLVEGYKQCERKGLLLLFCAQHNQDAVTKLALVLT